jgi:hypothetical protein
MIWLQADGVNLFHFQTPLSRSYRAAHVFRSKCAIVVLISCYWTMAKHRIFLTLRNTPHITCVSEHPPDVVPTLCQWLFKILRREETRRQKKIVKKHTKGKLVRTTEREFTAHKGTTPFYYEGTGTARSSFWYGQYKSDTVRVLKVLIWNKSLGIYHSI